MAVVKTNAIADRSPNVSSMIPSVARIHHLTQGGANSGTDTNFYISLGG
jgi:hypothetical protein